jgi:hypothetical protein
MQGTWSLAGVYKGQGPLYSISPRFLIAELGPKGMAQILQSGDELKS